MFVENKMTKNPVTVGLNTTLDEAAALMKRHNFRRLPVIDDGKVAGFFTDRDLLKVSPSPATTLSKYEINSLLSKLTVKEIMIKDVITISPKATIEEAALVMYQKKIGGLPVVSKTTGCIVGIITETDIFKAFVDIMVLNETTTRLTITGKDKVGVLRDISNIFCDMGIFISSLVSTKSRVPGGEFSLIVKAAEIDDISPIKERIEAAGYKLVHVVKIEKAVD
jgi:acetoin utilization protein AcuB